MVDDTVAIIGGYSYSNYLQFVTEIIPTLPINCYRGVEKSSETKNLFKNTLYETKVQTIDKDYDFQLNGDHVYFECSMDIEFIETTAQIESMEITNFTNLFLQRKKSFTNFLEKNCSKLKILIINYGYFKFHYFNLLLEKIPELNTLVLQNVKFEVDVKQLPVQRVNCQNLMVLEISNSDARLLDLFENCSNIKILKYFPLKNTFKLQPQPSLFTIIARYPSLEELSVRVFDKYRINEINVECQVI